MSSGNQNNPLQNNSDNDISIINRFFDFIDSTRRVNNRIISQNNDLVDMGFDITRIFLENSRNSNTNPVNPPRPVSNNNSTRSGRTRTSADLRTRLRNNSRRMAQRANNRNRNPISTNTRTTPIIQRDHDLFTRNVRSRNINNQNIFNRTNVNPLNNVIPMFGSIDLQSNTTNPVTFGLEQWIQSLQPVTIIPTPEQIQRATIIRPFQDIINPPNDTCPITRNGFNNSDQVLQIIECRHCFTPDSINRWFQTSVRCPICRYDIREYNPLNVINNPYRNNVNSSTQEESQTQEEDNQEENQEEETQEEETQEEETQEEETQEEENQEEETQQTTNTQAFARELVMNQHNNINNNSLSPEQRSIVDILNQTVSSTDSNNIVHTESSIDSNGNLNLVYQFGLDFNNTNQ